MSNRNVKVYKNSDRNKPEVTKKYVPQYQVIGVEPEEFESAVVPSGSLISKNPVTLPLTNPRARRPAIRQPYARVIPSPVGRGRGPVPNVGNNMEHTWSSVDGEIIDDLSHEMFPHQEMIDNNDFLSEDALGIDEVNHTLHSPKSSAKPFMTEKDLQEVINESDLSEVISDYKIKDDEYILLVNNAVFSIGSFEFIQSESKALIFGEHDICEGNPVPVEDLLILKRVKIKIGVFLE